MHSTENPKWTISEPQYYRDRWRGTIRRLNYTGRCEACNVRTYAFEDGENDPRGVLGNHAGSPLHASDYSKSGPSIQLCFLCANEEPRYRLGLKIAEGVWTDAKGVANG